MSNESDLAAPSEKLVMVIDDDEYMLGIIAGMLKGDGLQVVTAANGIDASAKLEQRPPDMIITDLMMPGQGGYEFLRALQGSESGRIPVFVMTGNTLNTSTIALIRQEANVVEFISKPISMDPFLQAVHAHLKTKPPDSRSHGKNRKSADEFGDN